MLVNVKLESKGYYVRITFQGLLDKAISNGTSKTKLAMLAFLYYINFVTNSVFKFITFKLNISLVF